MENPEEVLHCLEEFSKSKPSDIPRELEEYLCFVAKTGDPVYQWSIIKSLFREKMIRVITEFYEACPSIEIPPCPNVDIFNYDVMKNFILEKLETFSAAPFTVQRLCELLTTPRKEYNRIDKYMRALEKNILVVSTTEPGGGRRNNTENGENIVNGLENDHLPETSNSNDINVEEMDDTPPPPPSSTWSKTIQTETQSQEPPEPTTQPEQQQQQQNDNENQTVITESKTNCSSTQQESVICRNIEEKSIESDETTSPTIDEETTDVSNTAQPAGVQKRRNSIEPVVSSESEQVIESSTNTVDEDNSNDKIDDKVDKEDTSTTTEEISDVVDSSSNIIETVERKLEKIEEDTKVDEQPNDDNDEKIDENAAVTCSELADEPKESSINNEITSSDKSIDDDNDEQKTVDDVKVEESLNDNVNSEVDETNDDSKEISSTPMDVDQETNNDDDNDAGKVETTTEST